MPGHFHNQTMLHVFITIALKKEVCMYMEESEEEVGEGEKEERENCFIS